jgi:hypothetical protein
MLSLAYLSPVFQKRGLINRFYFERKPAINCRGWESDEAVPCGKSPRIFQRSMRHFRASSRIETSDGGCKREKYQNSVLVVAAAKTEPKDLSRVTRTRGGTAVNKMSAERESLFRRQNLLNPYLINSH